MLVQLSIDVRRFCKYYVSNVPSMKLMLDGCGLQLTKPTYSCFIFQIIGSA